MHWLLDPGRFLAAYGLTVGVVLLLALLWRWQVSLGGSGAVPGDMIELAYLTGGAALACYACLAALRQAGVVEPGHLGTVVARGALPRGSAALTAALHRALRTPRIWLDVRADADVRQALHRVERRLLKRGWLLTRGARLRFRCGTVPLFLVAAAGVVRLVADATGRADAGAAGESAGLILATGATLLLAWWLSEPPVVTRAGRRVVQRARDEHAGLAPGRRTDGAARTPAELMTAVALYGSRALLAVDPAFAVRVGGIPDQRTEFTIEKEKARV